LTIVPRLPSLDAFGSSAFDFKAGYVETMKTLAEAMAQECFWQQAVLGQFGSSEALLGRA
jgi:hypothetical protein